MFEKIIENALQKILGDYVEGLDGESLKLGVWSGDATVENLKLKPDAIIKLGLPFLVKYSYLGKLVLKVPWKSIQSSPIQATLDELIIEVEPLNEQDWKFGAVNPEEVLQQIENFKANLIAQLQEKQQSKDGMMDRLIIKIVENIQVKINNIHLRVNVKKQGCAFGVVLQTLTCLTINEKGQETFIDRTSEANKNLPLIKQLRINQFGVYWNTKAEQLDEQRLKNIFSVSGQDYLFLLDLYAQLTQPPMNRQDLPSYSLEFNLNQIDIKLSKFQLQQIITFSEYFRSYRSQKKLYIKSKMPKEVPKQLLDRFLQIYQQVPLDKKAPQVLSQNDQKEIIQILSQISFEDLEVHLKNLIKSLMHEDMKKNALKKKEQSQGGFLGLFAKKKPQQDINLNEEEQNEIIQYLDRNFSGDVQQQQVKTYYVKALLQKGSLSIINERQQHRDSFSIIFQQLTFEYVKSGLITTELRDLLLVFNYDSQDNQLLQKNQEVQMQQEAFMTINIIDNLIKLKTRSSTIQFNPNIIPVLQDYIALNVNADMISGVQDAADQAIIDIKQNVKQQEVSKYNYLIETDSLLIKLPIKDNQYWLINPGKLYVKGQSKNYEIKLSNIGFSHFVGEKQMSIIQDFNIEANIALIPNKINCNINIQEIGITINQDSYIKIIDISQCFQPSISLDNYKSQSLVKQTINLLEQNKQYLTQNCTKLGPLFIKEQLNWQKYICVLKDPYLYGFKSVKDDYPVFYKWIRHSTFQQQPLDEYGMHILEISNLENTFQISSNKESQLKDWREHFEKDADQGVIVQKQPDETQFNIQLELQKVSIKLIDQQQKPFFLLQTSKLLINFDTAPNKMELKLILEGIYAEDFLNNYEDPSLKYILDQGDDNNEKKELVSILLNRQSDVNKLFIDLSFGNIRVNFKCEVFAYILQFFLIPEQKQVEKLPIAETPTTNPDIDEYLDAEQQLERIQIKVHINRIHVIMVNQITKLKYFDLGFTNCNSQLIIYTNSKSIDLTLGNLFIRDLTNYPNTLFDEKDWNLIKPQNLLYNSDHMQSLIEFKLILRDDLSKLAKQNNNVTIDIQLKLSQIILNYIQQPVLRIIDYCKITVTDTFVKPNSFKVEGSQIRPNQLNKQKSKIIIEPELQPPQNLDDLLKNPYKMKIQVEINNPQIMVESLLSKDILILDLGKIIVTNEKKLQNDDVKKQNAIWREFYYIKLSNLKLKQTNDFIIDNCDLKLDISMPDLVDLYKFKQLEVSQSIKIDSIFSPVLLRITNQHLNSINKCLAYNINLDDHFDDFMTCNWGKSFQNINIAQQQQIIEQVKDQKRPTDKVFVHYTLNITRISIFVQENEDPLIQLQIIESNLDFKLLRNSKKEIKFQLQNFKGSQFIKQNNYFKQLPLIGTHSIKNVKPNLGILNQDSEILENKSLTMVQLEINLNPINIIKHFKVDLKLEGFSFVVWLKELLQLGQKFQFEQLKLLDNKFQGWTEVMAQKAENQNNDQAQQTQQEISVVISNLLFLIPKSLDEMHVIVAKTNLQFIFNKYELSTIPQLLQIMSEKNLELRDLQSRNYDFKAHLTIQDLEVFMSNKEQIFESANILSCPKRQIISPIKTTVNINHQLYLHEYLEHFIDTYSIQIIIQDIHVRVTFIDILILREFFNTLMPQKQGDAQQIEKQQQTIENNQAQKIDGKQYKAEFKLSNLEIEFFNDVDNNYQKLAKLLLSDNSFTYKLTDLVTEVKYLAYINLNYYNSAVQEWEPIIEPTDYEIFYTIDETTSKKLFVFFNSLNINFSTKMFHVLYDASMLLKQKLSQVQKNQVKYEEEALLNYGVYNLTGFNMFVEPQIDKNIQLIVENNQIQHFTMSGQNQKVNIQISYDNINDSIQNVTFRKKKIFTYKVKNEIILQQNIVDEGTNKRIAVFTGKYLINNMTHNLLTIQFQNQDYHLSPYMESQNYKLSKSQLSVPFQYLNQQLVIEFDGVRVKLPKLENFIKQLNQHIEILFTNKKFISAYCQKDPTLEGRYIINFLPSYRFINLLPFPIKYMIYSDKQEATKLQALGFQQETDIYEVKRDAVNGIQLHLEGYERSIIIDLNINLSQGNQTKVIVQGQQWQGSDGGQNEIILEVDISKYQQTGLKFVSIYSSAYIRNFTPYELIYYQGEENCHIVGGQIQGTKNKIMLLKQTQDNPNLVLTSRNTPGVKSQNKAQLKLLGRSSTEVFVQEQNKYKLIPLFVRSEVKVIQGIIQKIITLKPKIILVNQTNHILNIFNGFNFWQLEQNSRQPLQLLYINVIPQLGNEFQYKFQIQIENFEKSCDLEFLGPNQIFFQLKLQMDQMVRVYFQVDVIDFNDQLFAIFSQPAQPPYRIINKSKHFKLYLGMIPTTLEENQHVDFAYDNPYVNRVVLVNFLSLIPQLNSEQKKIETEKLLNQKMLKFQSNNLVYWIRLKIYIQGNTKLIVFSDANDIVQKQFKNINIQNLEFNEDEELVKFDDKQIKSNYQIIIPKFNLSVIENYKSKPMELLSLTIIGFQTFVVENLNKKLLLQIVLKELQLDNNQTQAICPVVIKSKSQQNILVSLIIEYDLRAEVIGVFDSIRLEILPLQITLDDRFLNLVLEYTKIIDQIISDCEYKQKIQQKEIMWQNCALPPPDKPTYIKSFIINTINLQVSFFLAGDKKGSKITSLIGAVGLKLVNIDEANLKFSGLRMIDVYDNFNLLTQKIIIHYKDQALSQLPVLIGSLAILGNPLKLFKNVTNGLVDFVEKPMEGLSKGPIEAYQGFYQGTTSLVTNTVAGTFDTVKTITGAVSSGLTQITMDDDYMRDRQRKSQQEKPQNISEGLQEGSKSFAKGIFKGVTGVLTKPIEGAQQGGAKGFLKGVWQGTTGLVMKPVVGAIDVVTMTSEGIKNSVGPNKSVKYQRQRLIRPFYDGQYYATYNQVDALGFELMNTTKKSKYQNHEFFKAVEFINQSSYLIIITNRIVILFDTESEQQIWGLKLENIKKIEIIERSLIRIFSKQPKQSWKVFNIQFFNPEQYLDYDKWQLNGAGLQILE